MAGGKLSPRQRMINLMYLVFIAMLALNVSKEVLKAFGLMTESIEASNDDAIKRNEEFYAGLVTKSNDEPAKYKPLLDKAQTVKAKGDELYNFIEGLKTEMNKTVENPKEYETKDKSDYLDNEFFNGEKLKPQGEKFLSLMDDYRNTVVNTIGADYPTIAESVKHSFSTDKVETEDGFKQEWIRYSYEGFPMVASEAKLTQLQSSIKSTEAEVLSAMLQGQMEMAASYSNYKTLMTTSKSAYYSGEKFDGQIALGRTDDNTKPAEVNLTLDGRKLSDSEFTLEGGKVVLNTNTGNVGEHLIKGQLVFKEGGEDVAVDVEQKYTVISKPNSATISADKMNVVYRGVDNPMTISFAGIPDNQVKATANGLSHKGGSSYMMKPGAGKEIKISVSGTLPDGKPVTDNKVFRIKDLPKPTGSFLSMTDDMMKLPKANIQVGDVGAKFEDFDFDLPLKVNSFKISVPGQPSITVNGNKMNAQAKSAITRARRGDVIQIFDIKASAVGNPVKIKNVSSFAIEVAN